VLETRSDMLREGVTEPRGGQVDFRLPSKRPDDGPESGFAFYSGGRSDRLS